MPLVTLVGKRQAQIGKEFVYLGRSTKCLECPLRKVCCDKLEPDRVYVVTVVRDRTHECPVHEEGVQIVEVEEATEKVALPTHQLFENAVLTFHPHHCDELECPNYEACNPKGLRTEDRCRVEKVLQKANLPCSKERKLGLAIVRRVV